MTYFPGVWGGKLPCLQLDVIKNGNFKESLFIGSKSEHISQKVNPSVRHDCGVLFELSRVYLENLRSREEMTHEEGKTIIFSRFPAIRLYLPYLLFPRKNEQYLRKEWDNFPPL